MFWRLVCALISGRRLLSQQTNNGRQKGLEAQAHVCPTRRVWASGLCPLISNRVLPCPMDPLFDHQDRAPDDRQCTPHQPPQMDRLMKCVQLIQIWEGSRRPGAELQKKGTNSLTITGVMCMYTVESTYAGGIGRGALNCHPKATNKKQNILTRWSLRVRSWNEECRVCWGSGKLR